MHEELNQLATLKLSGETERRTRQMREKLIEAQNEYASKAAANVISGPHQKALAQIRIDCSVDLTREFAKIWMGLVRQKNNGSLQRKDVPVLTDKIQKFGETQLQHLRAAIGQQRSGAATNYLLELADIQMHAVVADLRRELRIAVEEHEAFSATHQKEVQMQPAPKIYSIGRRVLVGRQRRPATVTFCDDKPSQMGDFRHEVLYDDGQAGAVMSMDIIPFPATDDDLNINNQAVIHLHIENSQIANLNLGSQVGTINAAIQSLETKDVEVAKGLKQLTEAVLSQQQLSVSAKQEIVEVLSTIAESAAKAPDQRPTGPLKASLAYIPTLIGVSSQLVTLWDKLEPLIKAHLGM